MENTVKITTEINLENVFCIYHYHSDVVEGDNFLIKFIDGTTTKIERRDKVFSPTFDLTTLPDYFYKVKISKHIEISEENIEDAVHHGQTIGTADSLILPKYVYFNTRTFPELKYVIVFANRYNKIITADTDEVGLIFNIEKRNQIEENLYHSRYKRFAQYTSSRKSNEDLEKNNYVVFNTLINQNEEFEDIIFDILIEGDVWASLWDKENIDSLPKESEAGGNIVYLKLTFADITDDSFYSKLSKGGW